MSQFSPFTMGSPHLVEGTFTHGYLARTTFCHFEMTGLWRPFPGR